MSNEEMAGVLTVGMLALMALSLVAWAKGRDWLWLLAMLGLFAALWFVIDGPGQSLRGTILYMPGG
jgi:hypothetical protein